MQVTKVENADGTVTYKGVTIEIEDAKAAKDLTYMLERGFVNWGHNPSPRHILGEPEGLYMTDQVLKADIRIYTDIVANNFQVNKDVVLKVIEHSIPSVSGKILARNEDGSIKEFLLTGVSLGPNNIDPNIDRISVQMKYSDPLADA